MLLPDNTAHIYGLLEFIVEKLLYPALLIFLTHWVGKRSQVNQWVREKKFQEYSDLLDILLERKEDILLEKSSGTIEAVGIHDQAERTRKYLAVGRTFQDRLFIDDAVRRLNALERWNSIERMAADYSSSYVDCQTKLNDLINEIRNHAKYDVQ